MRHALVAAFLLVSSSSLADPKADAKAVEKLVKSSILDLAKLRDNSTLGFTDGAVIYSAHGGVIANTEDGCVTGAVANAFYGCMQGSVDHKPGAISAGTSGNIAWFQAPFTATISTDSLDGPTPKPQKDPLRFGGIVVGGQIIAAMYTRPISDKDLLAGTGGTPATGAPKLTGDQKLAGVVAGWFTSGFAPQAAKKVNLIASGTSPRELKSGAGAVTLAKGWDKLKLGATEIDAKLLAGGKVGWVHAVVMLPRKGGKGAVQMQLAVVAIPDGDTWRWVSLMYQPYESNI